jgi:predicted nucleic acid-binding Zn ribbon protein
MPKYQPTEQDVWEVTVCPICGKEVGAEQKYCDWRCEQQWQIFKDDFEMSLMDDLEEW